MLVEVLATSSMYIVLRKAVFPYQLNTEALLFASVLTIALFPSGASISMAISQMRELMRVENCTVSPLFSHLSSTISNREKILDLPHYFSLFQWPLENTGCFLAHCHASLVSASPVSSQSDHASLRANPSNDRGKITNKGY